MRRQKRVRLALTTRTETPRAGSSPPARSSATAAGYAGVSVRDTPSAVAAFFIVESTAWRVAASVGAGAACFGAGFGAGGRAPSLPPPTAPAPYDTPAAATAAAATTITSQPLPRTRLGSGPKAKLRGAGGAASRSDCASSTSYVMGPPISRPSRIDPRATALEGNRPDAAARLCDLYPS